MSLERLNSGTKSSNINRCSGALSYSARKVTVPQYFHRGSSPGLTLDIKALGEAASQMSSIVIHGLL
jgi:hypothetical protein